MQYQNKKVIIIGGSGFVGTQLALYLQNEGALVVIVDPRPTSLKNVMYIKSDLQYFSDFDVLQKSFAVFNLAGIPIFGRWNKKYKEQVRTSRILTTHNIIEKFKNPIYRPDFFVSTSAIGVYGDRGDELLNEYSKTIPNTYLAKVAHDWEQEALNAEELGVQVRIIRNAHVLGRGGILGVLKKVFKTGLGGSLGNGKQYMSFVSIEKCIQAYADAPFSDLIIKNAVSIEPLQNKKFSQKIAQILSRPCLFRIPVWSIRLIYGEFGREIVTSQRVHTISKQSFEDIGKVLKENL
jgi:uncharacterized protein (TIGR01777 family)